MPNTEITFTYNETSTQWLSNNPVNQGDKFTGMEALNNYTMALKSGSRNALVSVRSGAVSATATLTSTGSAVNNETCVICGVTFTAKTSGATGNQFNISATPATQAANIAAAVNGSTNLVGIVTATSASGVTTITAVVPGIMGNGLQITEGLTNVSLSDFVTLATGSNGTSTTLDFT